MRVKFVFVLLFVFMAASAQAAVINIKVLPGGDGIAGKDRYGSFSNWEDVPFDLNANPNIVLHYYESWDYYGSQRDTYLQFSLAGFDGTADDIVSASFNFNLLSTSPQPDRYNTMAAKLYHAANASTATGDASQKISGNEWVGDVPVGMAIGWKSFDVTNFVKNDVQNSYNWSVYSFNNQGYAGMSFSSGEDVELASYLSIVTAGQSVPLPGAVWLLGSGLVGLLGLRGKRRA